MISSASASSIPAMPAVEHVEIAPGGVDPRPVLAAVQIGRVTPGHQILQRQHAFGVAQVPRERTPRGPREGREVSPRSPPNASGQLAGRSLPSSPNPGLVQPALLQAIEGEAGLVAQPLLVHRIVRPRQDAQDFGATGVDADRGPPPRPAHRRCRSCAAPRDGRRRRTAWRSAHPTGQISMRLPESSEVSAFST